MDVQRQIEFLLENQARHDALLGKIAENQARNDAQIAKIAEGQARNDAQIAKLMKLQEKNEELQTKNELLMADLISAVMSHERRIGRLEEGRT